MNSAFERNVVHEVLNIGIRLHEAIEAFALATLLVDLLNLLTALEAVDGIATSLAKHRFVDSVVTNDAL